MAYFINNLSIKNTPCVIFQTIIILFFLANYGCVTKNTRNDYKLSAEKSFIKAKNLYDRKQYNDTILKLDEFLSKFPYSNHVNQASLMIANAYFYNKNFSAAVVSYQKFLLLFPEDAQIDYVTYKIGMSYWNESSNHPDQAQQFTEKSLKIWGLLRKNHPDSKYISQIQPYIVQGQKRLSKAKFLVAKFYCNQQKYYSCIFVLENFINKNQLQIDPETTIKASLLGIKAIEFVLEDLAKNTELYSSQDFYLTKSINQDLWIEKLQKQSTQWKDMISFNQQSSCYSLSKIIPCLFDFTKKTMFFFMY